MSWLGDLSELYFPVVKMDAEKNDLFRCSVDVLIETECLSAQ